MKFFFTADIEEKKNDRKWMSKATELIRLKIKDKNERAAKSRALRGLPKVPRKVQCPQPTATQPMEIIPMTVIPRSAACLALP